MFVNRTIVFMGAEAVTVFILLTDAVPSLCLPIDTYSILYWPLSKGSIMYIILCKLFMGAEATIAFVFAFNYACLCFDRLRAK